MKLIYFTCILVWCAVFTSICMNVSTNVHIYAWMHVYMYLCVHVYMCVCVCLYVCMCVCMCVRKICMYVHVSIKSLLLSITYDIVSYVTLSYPELSFKVFNTRRPRAPLLCLSVWLCICLSVNLSVTPAVSGSNKN